MGLLNLFKRKPKPFGNYRIKRVQKANDSVVFYVQEKRFLQSWRNTEEYNLERKYFCDVRFFKFDDAVKWIKKKLAQEERWAEAERNDRVVAEDIYYE